MHRLAEQNKTKMAQSEQALQDFKMQVERNSNKVYGDLKQQVLKMGYWAFVVTFVCLFM